MVGKTSKAIGVIPARAGSKRVPGKNFKIFHGKPIISYPIRAMLESELYQRVVVSTDSPEIAKVAEKHGAEVPFLRPGKLARDDIATIDVIIHAIQYLEIDPLDSVSCVYATNPFLTPELIRATFDLHTRSTDVDYVTTVSKYAFPPQRSLAVIDGNLKISRPEFTYSHSQDLPPLFHETAQLWWGSARTWLNRVSMQNKLRAILLPDWAHQDIDTLDDWKSAELKYELLKKRTRWPIPLIELSQSIIG